MSDDDDSMGGRNTEFSGVNMQLIVAAKNGKADTLQELLERGANIKCKDNHGWTALHWGAANGHMNIIKKLCKHLSGNERELVNYMNIRENITGWTALHVSELCAYKCRLFELNLFSHFLGGMCWNVH